MIDRICSLIKMKRPAMNAGLLFASGETVPVDGTLGYQSGCIFQHTDGNAGSVLYVNEGTETSCLFNAVAVGGDQDVFNVGSFSSVTAGSGIALSSSVPAAASVYGDDNGLAITANVYNLRTRLLLTVDQSATSIRALMAQLKLAGGVDVATGIYTANQGYLELVGTHVAQAGATLSCMDASLEIGTKLTVDSGGEACGIHVETTGSGTIENSGTCAGVLIDKAAGAASWPVGIQISPTAVDRGIVIGAEEFGAAGTGIVVNGVDLHSGCEFYFDDGGVKLAAGYTEAFRAGYLISTTIDGDTDVSCYTSHDYIYIANSVATRGGVGATWASLLVKAGETISTTAGVCDFSAFNASVDVPSTAVIGANTWACGLAIGGNLGGTHTGKAAGIRLRVPSAGKWDVGLRIEPTSCVYAYQVGEGKYASADSGYGIPLSSASQHSGAEMYFDDGGVMLTAGWIEAVMQGFLVTQAITTADVSLYTAHDYVYLAANVTTAGGVGAAWASMLVKTGVTITTSSGICDFSAFNASCDVPSGATIGANTFVAGLSIGGNLGGTHTGVAVGIRLRPASAGDWDGLFDIPTEIRVETADAAADVEGSIKIYINGVAKYLQYWPNPAA